MAMCGTSDPLVRKGSATSMTATTLTEERIAQARAQRTAVLAQVERFAALPGAAEFRVIVVPPMEPFLSARLVIVAEFPDLPKVPFATSHGVLLNVSAAPDAETATPPSEPSSAVTSLANGIARGIERVLTSAAQAGVTLV